MDLACLEVLIITVCYRYVLRFTPVVVGLVVTIVVVVVTGDIIIIIIIIISSSSSNVTCRFVLLIKHRHLLELDTILIAIAIQLLYPLPWQDWQEAVIVNGEQEAHGNDSRLDPVT